MCKSILRRGCLILLFVLMILCCVGCSNHGAIIIGTNNGNIKSTDTKVEEKIRITLDESAIVNTYYSIDMVKTELTARLNDKAYQISNSLNTKIYNTLLLADEETSEILETYLNGIIVQEMEWQGNIGVIGIKFNSLDIYRYFYKIEKEILVKHHVESNFFYNSVYYSDDVIRENKCLMLNTQSIINYYSSFITSTNNEIEYVYKTEYSRRGSNADSIVKLGNNYYHTWNINLDDEHDEVLFRYNIANRSNWLVACLGIGLVITGIIAIIGIIINKNYKKSKNIEK